MKIEITKEKAELIKQEFHLNLFEQIGIKVIYLRYFKKIKFYFLAQEFIYDWLGITIPEVKIKCTD